MKREESIEKRAGLYYGKLIATILGVCVVLGAVAWSEDVTLGEEQLEASMRKKAV